MTLITAIVTPDHSYSLAYTGRWIDEAGRTSGVSGEDYEAAIEAALEAWPDGIVVVTNSSLAVSEAVDMAPVVASYLADAGCPGALHEHCA